MGRDQKNVQVPTAVVSGRTRGLAGRGKEGNAHIVSHKELHNGGQDHKGQKHCVMHLG
ncbi:hypothetical protein Hanom_Chr13g01230071 [Helianthus anomalus]